MTRGTRCGRGRCRRIGLLAWLLVVGLPLDAMSGDLCFGVGSWTMDCQQIDPTAHPIDWLGFVENDNPCRHCVHPNDWGGCDSAYVWTISSSEAYAYGWPATLPPDGWLYLWLWDTPQDGASLVHLELTGDLVPLEFELIHEAALYVPGAPDVLDIVLGGCPSNEVLVGRIRVQDPSSVEGRTWGRTKSMYR